MEQVKGKNTSEKYSKLYSIMMVLIISILLIGFIFMSWILFDILRKVDNIARDFIDFVKDLFNLEIQTLFKLEVYCSGIIKI